MYFDESGAKYSSTLYVSKERNKYDEDQTLGLLNYLSDRFGYHGQFKEKFGISLYLCGNPQILEVSDSGSVEKGVYRKSGTGASQVRAVYVTMWLEFVDDDVAFNYTPKYHARVFDHQTCKFVWTKELTMRRYRKSQANIKRRTTVPGKQYGMSNASQVGGIGDYLNNPNYVNGVGTANTSMKTLRVTNRSSPQRAFRSH